MNYSTRYVRYFPREPSPWLLVVGEAPGPRGADRTGYPFWGDDSGLEIYGLIASLGLLSEPFTPWKRRADLTGTRPPLGRYCITNACPRMPLAEAGGFTAPEPARLKSEAGRIAEEILELKPRVVLACGRAAVFTLACAAQELGGPVPGPLDGVSFSGLRVFEAMRALLDGEPWRVGSAAAFVTAHPARGNWRRGMAAGELHAQVVARLRERLEPKQTVRA
ncbi:MAG TPA: hypothetical protein DFS52_01935 [Myxococcales bacterium]|jgi:uracil-DNA glycosylase|nr:hypothetical protein [Myxococcales bacterium]